MPYLPYVGLALVRPGIVSPSWGVVMSMVVCPQFVRVCPVYFVAGAVFRCRIGRRGAHWEVKLLGAWCYESADGLGAEAKFRLLVLMFETFETVWGRGAGVDRLFSMLEAWRDGVHANELRAVCHD